MKRSTPIALVGALVGALAAALLFTGCTGAADPERGAGAPPSPVVATLPVGELSSAPESLAVGDEIRVIVDTPEIEWEVTSSDPAVLEVEDAGKNPGVVRLVAVAEGAAEVVFDGGTEDAQDRALVTVGRA